MAKKKKNKKHKWILVFSVLFLLFALSATSLAVYLFITIRQLPPLDQFNSRQVSQTTKIFDRTGKILLYEVYNKEKRTIIPFEEIPDYLKEATLAAEDAEFYSEPAFDWKAILRAVIVNIKKRGFVQGGSTITQQLVKSVFLTPEKTITRKLKELILAIKLESRYSKDEIFAAYLNQIPYGSNAYGVEAAAQTYFNKSAKDLTLAEAAIIAALPKAPTYYSPWGSHVDELLNRKDYILDRMYQLGFISQDELVEAKKENVRKKFSYPSIGSIRAPHFALAVKNYLINRYGEDLVSRGGLKVITTLDWEIQQKAQAAVAKGALSNEEKYGGKNAAMVVQDPKTGQILALVGSRNYFDPEIDGKFNVATQGLRQPGSALKPFAYLTAFSKGFSPKSVVFDVPTEFVSNNPDCPPVITYQSSTNKDCFNPENFDGAFRGPVSFETALSQSINVPSVKVLYLAGFDNVLNNLHKFGITTLNERWRYGLSLVLGGGEVRLVDLVNAYATLSQEGVKHNQTMILKIENSKGEVLEQYQDQAEKVFDPQPVREINKILSDINLRSGLFHSSLNMTIFPGREVALKTGTTNDYRDAWAIGYTTDLVVGVWAGNNDYTQMHREGSSILAAVPIWSDFLKNLFQDRPDLGKEPFKMPESKPLPNKPMLNGEVIFSPEINGKTYPQIHSILFWVNKKDPLGPIPSDPGQDPQFYNWETSVLNWAMTQIPNFTSNYNKPIDLKLINQKTITQSQSDVKIINFSPKNGSFVKQPLFIKANIASKKGLKRIELYFNNKLVNSLKVSGNNYNYFYYLLQPINNQNIITLKAFNIKGESLEKTIVVFKKN